jgi:TPP-dependent pyruvate/acetoin dehydrogenase alpha subunit
LRSSGLFICATVPATSQCSLRAASKAKEQKVASECEDRVDAAIKRYLATAPRPPETMFDHLYAKLPSAYVGQRKEIEDQNA